MTDQTHIANPGDRQPKETPPAFEAFRTYLAQGPARSTAKVSQALGKSKTLIDRWSSRWSWVERCRLIDSADAGAEDEGRREQVREIAERQAREARMHAAATTAISQEVVRRIATAPGGAEEALKGVPTTELVRAMNSAARAHNRAIVTERLALGMTTEQAGERIPREEAALMAARLSDDELDARLAPVDELAERRESKRGPARKAAGSDA